MEIEVAVLDVRTDYGEDRYRAFGLLDGEPHCLVFTYRRGEIRAISLRRAHRKEYRRHVP
ncbi:MAG: BrnT family toxin [Caulobacteraceae bacterium]